MSRVYPVLLVSGDSAEEIKPGFHHLFFPLKVAHSSIPVVATTADDSVRLEQIRDFALRSPERGKIEEKALPVVRAALYWWFKQEWKRLVPPGLTITLPLSLAAVIPERSMGSPPPNLPGPGKLWKQEDRVFCSVSAEDPNHEQRLPGAPGPLEVQSARLAIGLQISLPTGWGEAIRTYLTAWPSAEGRLAALVELPDGFRREQLARVLQDAQDDLAEGDTELEVWMSCWVPLIRTWSGKTRPMHTTNVGRMSSGKQRRFPEGPDAFSPLPVGKGE